MIDDFLTVKQVAEKLDLLPHTIRNYIRTGKLKAIQVNNTYLIKTEDLEEFIKNRG